MNRTNGLKLCALSLILFTIWGCGSECEKGIFSAVSGGQCSELTSNFSSKHVGSAACSGVPSSRKINISCTKGGSGTHSLCSHSAGSDGANYLVVLMPNDGSGAFNDSTVGTIHDCAGLWAAMSTSTLPSDLLGIYYSDTSTGDGINCPVSDAGCSHVTNNCVSSWNLALGGGTEIPAEIASGSSVLVCAFLDTPLPGGPAAGAPPVPNSGVLAPAVSSQFAHVTVGSEITLSTWVDY